ncbi:hypothetical protein CF124_02025 [Aeromonas hydrophila]|nr:hypothetical protein CF124_02025 [Aeromonas hydrophila]
MVEHHLMEGGSSTQHIKASFETTQLAPCKKGISYHQRAKATIAMYRYKQWISPKLSLKD